MKKAISGFLSLLLALSLSLTSALATSTSDLASQIKSAYDSVASYYASLDSLTDEDSVIAAIMVGLDADDLTIVLYDDDTDFTSYDTGSLGKLIVALVMAGEDPTNINGTDLVALLESYIGTDGKVHEYGYEVYASSLVWVLYALEVVDSDYVSTVASALASQQWRNGGFSWTYEDYGYYYHYDESGNFIYDTEATYNDDGEQSNYYYGATADVDTTAWVIEALTIAGEDTYSETIEKALCYLHTNYTTNTDGNPYWDNYGDNVDTQANALQALLVYDEEGVKSGSYDVDGNSPYTLLLSYQNTDGTFWYTYYYTYYSETYNAYGTAEAARSLGTYFNGSFVYVAQAIYAQTLAEDEETVTEVETVETETVEENDSDEPQTGDATNVLGWLMLMMGSVYVLKRKLA